MEKEQFIQTYIDLETKTFVRKEKSKKMNELFELMKEQGKVFTLDELLYILNYLRPRNIIIRQPFFMNIVYPILSENIEKNNVDAIKAMIKLGDPLLNYRNITGDYHYYLRGLIDKGLSISPDDAQLLSCFLGETGRVMDRSLREIPIGVLYDGVDGASIEECDELLELLDRYEAVCRKLNVKEEKWVSICRYYYTTYKEYLGTDEDYDGYEDFLIKNYDGVIDRRPW